MCHFVLQFFCVEFVEFDQNSKRSGCAKGKSIVKNLMRNFFSCRKSLQKLTKTPEGKSIVKNLMRNFFSRRKSFQKLTKTPEGKSIIKNLMHNFFLVENYFKNSTKIPEEGKSIIKNLMHNFYPQKKIVSKRQPKVRKVGYVTSKPYRSLYFRKSAILICPQTIFNLWFFKKSSKFVQQTLFVKLIFQFQI